MNVTKVASTIGGFVVVVAIVLGFKFYNKGQANAEVKSEAAKIVQSLPGYQRNQAYYDSLVEHAHPIAFEVAYSMGGRRRSAKFNDQKYLSVLIAEMIKKARSDGKTDVVNAFTQSGASR